MEYRRHIGPLLGLTVLYVLTGCSSDLYRTFTLDKDPTTSLGLDARQRVLLSTDKAGVDHKSRVVCAEPSPDAIVSIAASGLLKLPLGDTELMEARARSAETVTQLGTRTQTIQLLRDALYRACEGYLNGAINKPEYLDILYMYDDFVVTLLAIEALSNVRAPYGSAEQKVTVAGQASESASPRQPSDAGSTANSTPVPTKTFMPPDVPAVIRDLVFKYLDNQMELYRGMKKH